MKKNILVLLVVFIGFSSFAQQSDVRITGKVIDKETNEPLEYATITFSSIKENKIVTGGITQANGDFNIPVPAGIYNISIEFISFKTENLSKQKLFKNTNLGTIGLGLDTEALDDVVIIAEKTTVEIKLDKKIYNVGKDLTVSGGTVSDVLDNVPSVSVDVEGNVALRGNDNVRILINGKPSGLVGLNSTDALRQLPAESIERVEVITSPSARYDAEGTAGILNIILRRSKLQGLNGALTFNTGYPLQVGVSGNINYRTGDLNFFTTSGYNYREVPGNSLSETQFFNFDTDTQIDEPDTFLNEKRDFDRIRKGLNTNVGLEWYINDSSSITGSFLYRSSDNESNTSNLITEPDVNGNILSSNLRFDPEVEDDITKQYAINYNKNFDDSGHKLTFDFQIENSEEDESSRITQENVSTIELVNTLEKQDRILIQSDYVLPIGKKSQFELGYRGNFNELDTEFLVQFDDSGVVTTDTNLSNNLIFKEQVNAAYSQFGSKAGKFSYLLGLRLESTRITIDQQTSGDFNKKIYTDIFPTINLGYKLSEKQSLTLGYNRRIRRPRSRFINPFPSRSSATNIFQGNSDLNPSYSNVFDLGYLNRMGKLTLNSSIYYNRSTQIFTFIAENTGDTAIIGDGTIVPIIRRTPINLSSSDRYGFEFTLTYSPTKKWRINGNFNAFQNSIKGDFNGENFDADNFSWFARLNNKITLPAKIDWQTTAFYAGPNENAQTKSEGLLSVNLAFSKDLFKEKASLTFNVSDLFNSRKRQSVSTTETFITDSEFQWRERSFTLSFTYRFNQKKKRQRSRNNFNGGGEEFEGKP
ncbi:Outer membrane receptor proteins, mostly Fe transport [Aquimarina amphilecti]|uniref:Outer membrane receptor proteins, mostly Fe transport n=1 Tax=Aquimarina amphilecti TaxID=1038014 RepID=A0A1H7VZD9_AQUAM|nr:TonB-dependent receptor [Aquimarina amphilecti]SEM14229.1 Outer membrane receptor proteins, mostly Fe transport [Aquimarina amphilecti]